MNYICQHKTEEEREIVKRRLVSLSSCTQWASGSPFIKYTPIDIYYNYFVYTQFERGWRCMGVDSYEDALQKIERHCSRFETYPKIIKPLKVRQNYIT